MFERVKSVKVPFAVLLLALAVLIAALVAGAVTTPADAGKPKKPKGHSYDLVIMNGEVADPANQSIRKVNIGIEDGKIAAITTTRIGGRQVINAEGLVVSPGWIDVHTHAGDFGADPLLSTQVFAADGVTTMISSNCGLGHVDTGAWLESLAGNVAGNIATQVGHQMARWELGLTEWNDVPTSEQIAEMKAIMKQQLEEGAIGVSMGLEYVPLAPPEEVEMCFDLAAEYDVPIIVHVRGDCWEMIDSIDEMAHQMQRTGVSVSITHLAYMGGFGQMTECLERIDYWRAQGLKMWSDSGVYWAFATGIQTAVFNEGWLEEYNAEYSDLLILDGPYAGQWCTEEIFYELRAAGEDTSVAAFVGVEDECAEALDHVFAGDSYVTLSSDGAATVLGEGHPQTAGTNARYLSWVREGKIKAPLIEAIRKMTLYPANQMGLADKGRMQVGADADITIFDPETIQDNADFPVEGTDQDPQAPPDGIPYVIVNGHLVVCNGTLTGALSGVGIPRQELPISWPLWQ